MTYVQPNPSQDRKPSGKQVFKLCALLLDAAELEWPASMSDASELIQRLMAAQTAKVADDCPL